MFLVPARSRRRLLRLARLGVHDRSTALASSVNDNGMHMTACLHGINAQTMHIAQERREKCSWSLRHARGPLRKLAIEKSSRCAVKVQMEISSRI